MASFVYMACDGIPHSEQPEVAAPPYDEVCDLSPVNTLVDLPRLGLRQGEMSPVNRMPESLSKLPEDGESPFPAHESSEGDFLLWLQMPLPIDTSVDNSSFATSEWSAVLSPCGVPWPASSYVQCNAPVRQRSRHVTFAGSPTHSVHRSEFGVQPYSEVYGVHPRDFDFDVFGQMVSKMELVGQPSSQPYGTEDLDLNKEDLDLNKFEGNMQTSDVGSQTHKEDDGMDTFDFAAFAEWSANIHRPKLGQSVRCISYGKYDFRASTTSADFSFGFKGFAQPTWNAPTEA